MSHHRRQTPADGTKDGAIIGGGREPDTIIRRHQLRAVIGYSIGHIYELVSRAIPCADSMGPRAIGWFAREVEQWQQARKAERDSTGEAVIDALPRSDEAPAGELGSREVDRAGKADRSELDSPSRTATSRRRL